MTLLAPSRPEGTVKTLTALLATAWAAFVRPAPVERRSPESLRERFERADRVLRAAEAAFDDDPCLGNQLAVVRARAAWQTAMQDHTAPEDLR